MERTYRTSPNASSMKMYYLMAIQKRRSTTSESGSQIANILDPIKFPTKITLLVNQTVGKPCPGPKHSPPGIIITLEQGSEKEKQQQESRPSTPAKSPWPEVSQILKTA